MPMPVNTPEYIYVVPISANLVETFSDFETQTQLIGISAKLISTIYYIATELLKATEICSASVSTVYSFLSTVFLKYINMYMTYIYIYTVK